MLEIKFLLGPLKNRMAQVEPYGMYSWKVDIFTTKEFDGWVAYWTREEMESKLLNNEIEIV